MSAATLDLPRLSRRVFVRTLGRGAVGAALLPWIACEAGPPQPGGSDAGEPDARADAPTTRCPPFLTPTEDFFQQFGGSHTVEGWSMPELDAGFALRIDGLVATPLVLDLAALQAEAMPQTVLKTMLCVLGWRSTGLFTGVPLRGLLERAGIDRSQTKRVRFYGSDGFENNLKLEDIFEPPSGLFPPLIAFALNGEPLPREHGYPFRLLLNDRFGFKNIKWLSRIEATAEDRETGQYQQDGYPDAGIIEPTTSVENLRLHDMVPAGAVELCGFALSGQAGIERVEVSVDGGNAVSAEGSQLKATLDAYPQLASAVQLAEVDRLGFPPPGVWMRWRAQLDLPAGSHQVAMRVIDRDGRSADGVTLTLEATA